METSDLEIKEYLSPLTTNDYAVIEHFLIGSTPHVKGRDISKDEVMSLIEKTKGSDAEALEARKTLLTPLVLLNATEPLDPNEVETRRETERRTRGHYGFVTVLDPSSYDILERNTWLKPSSLDTTTGLIVPEWEIYYLNMKNIIEENQRMVKLLTLRPNYQNHFTLKSVPKQPYKVLSLNLPN